MGELLRELEELQFHPKWLESGFITKEWLQATFEQFCNSVDKHTEHYRYGAFLYVLSSKPLFSDEELEKYIALAKIDIDKGMAEAALGALINVGLKQDKLDWFNNHPAYQTKRLQKILKQKLMLREIELNKTERITKEQFERFVESKDEWVQRILLWQGKLSHDQVKALSICGANKAVRNIANQELRRKKYRE